MEFHLKPMTQEIESYTNQDATISQNLNNQAEDQQLRQGEFMLTYLQVLLINKKMPKGYKLELEEVYVKTAEQANNFIGKKRAMVSFILLNTIN
jgi:hypothetical protein